MQPYLKHTVKDILESALLPGCTAAALAAGRPWAAVFVQLTHTVKPPLSQCPNVYPRVFLMVSQRREYNFPSMALKNVSQHEIRTKVQGVYFYV